MATGCSSRQGVSASGSIDETSSTRLTEAPSSLPTPSAGQEPAPRPSIPGGRARFVQHGPSTSARAALTFHVAGDPAAARRLFDEAARLQLPLTLFLVGTFVTANADYVSELAKAGHEVANHTATHPTLGRLGAAAVASEVRGCRDELEAATGQAGRWFRPSGMDVATPLVLEQAVAAGYDTVVGYDVDPRDYQDPGSAAVIDRVRSGLHPGAIVSLHTAHEGTVVALPQIAAAARSGGLSLVTLSDLLGPA